jgi:hypothetical protein
MRHSLGRGSALCAQSLQTDALGHGKQSPVCYSKSKAGLTRLRGYTCCRRQARASNTTLGAVLTLRQCLGHCSCAGIRHTLALMDKLPIARVAATYTLIASAISLVNRCIHPPWHRSLCTSAPCIVSSGHPWVASIRA